MSRFLTDTLDGIEITRAEDVKKHGEHDQSSHGSWAHGMSVEPEVVDKILNRVKSDGGLSIKMTDGSEPTKGFMVAKGKKYAAIVKADDFYNPDKGAEILSSYMKQHKADLATGKNYLGLWHNKDDGQVYLDVSENIQDEAEATSRGRSRDQISIWDVANFKEIPTGGTGGIEKTRGGRTARFITDDRRTNRRIRKDDLGEVGRRQSTAKVIYFDFGLKPVLKHGDHDQSSHGNWATQGYSEDEVKRIEGMKDLGPKKEDLDKVWDAAKSNEIDRDKAEMMIDNDSFLNDTIEQTISERYDQKETELGRVLSEDERVELYDEYRNDAVNSLIDSEPDYLENFSQENGYGSLKNAEAASELQDAFNDVYSIEHEGTFREGTENAGQSVTLRSEVTNVVVDGDGIHVYSNVYDADGNLANTSREVERIFVKDEASGTWSVEHEWFELDESYRGTGFGGQFLRQSEDWYISQGITHISTLGGLDDGARHWANAGFDFDRDNLDAAVGTIRQGIARQEYQVADIRAEYGDDVANQWQANITEAKGLLSRMVDEATGKIKDMTNDDFPKPHDFSSLGSKNPITVNDTKQWFGKSLLEGRAIYYVKALTAEGRNLLAGPIDMDGDGVVYDGTPREKPAPRKND